MSAFHREGHLAEIFWPCASMERSSLVPFSAPVSIEVSSEFVCLPCSKGTTTRSEKSNRESRVRRVTKTRCKQVMALFFLLFQPEILHLDFYYFEFSRQISSLWIGLETATMPPGTLGSWNRSRAEGVADHPIGSPNASRRPRNGQLELTRTRHL